jgi:hypothetical protein
VFHFHSIAAEKSEEREKHIIGQLAARDSQYKFTAPLSADMPANEHFY